MSAHVETQQFFFEREQFMLRPFLQVAFAFRHRRSFILNGPEERALAFLLVRQDAGRPRQCALDLRRQGCPRLAETIARAGFDKCFQGLFTKGAPIYPLA